MILLKQWFQNKIIGVNFINVLLAPFTCADLERAKKTDNLTVFFVLSGSGPIKAAHRTLMKLQYLDRGPGRLSSRDQKIHLCPHPVSKTPYFRKPSWGVMLGSGRTGNRPSSWHICPIPPCLSSNHLVQPWTGKSDPMRWSPTLIAFLPLDGKSQLKKKQIKSFRLLEKQNG